MKLDSLLNQLELFRIRCEENTNDFDSTLKVELINMLVEYIGNDKIKNKIEEIPF